MADIAEYDKTQMKNIALIHTLENEMMHKFKELSDQVASNPGLQPIVDKYGAHLKTKKAEAHAMQDYFQSLLMSLHSLTPPHLHTRRHKSKKQKKRGGGGGSGSGSDGRDSEYNSTIFFNKLVIDEQAIMREIRKWGEQINHLKNI